MPNLFPNGFPRWGFSASSSILRAISFFTEPSRAAKSFSASGMNSIFQGIFLFDIRPGHVGGLVIIFQTLLDHVGNLVMLQQFFNPAEGFKLLCWEYHKIDLIVFQYVERLLRFGYFSELLRQFS